MAQTLLLASGSEIRLQMLRAAGVTVEAHPARIDEDAIKASLIAEDATAHDIADALAEFKADRVSRSHSDKLVLGADQVLEIDGKLLSKPVDRDDALAQLRMLRGKTHRLYSAAVLYETGQPVWRHVGTTRMTMRPFSDAYLDDYVARCWDSIRHSVGGYKLEEEGVRLFQRIDGDYFTVLGLPMLELLGYLTLKGVIAG